MHYDVDKSSDYNPKSVQLYVSIHEYFEAGYSYRAISKLLHCSRNTVTKYLEGNYDSLCRRNFRSGMDQFYNYIIKELSAGVCKKDINRSLIVKGYTGKQTAAYDYMNKIIKRFHMDIAVYRSSSSEAIQKRNTFKNMIIYQDSGYFVSSG